MQTSLPFYTRYGLRSLRRGGQRTFLALVCIAFGVMSLVAMQSLAGIFSSFLVSNPRTSLGGDISVTNGHADPLTSDQIAQLEQLRQSGQLQAYTLTAATESTMLLKPNGTGHVYVLGSKALGVDPATYPLIGTFTLRDNTQTLARALAAPDSAVVTRDIADRLNLKPGDSFTLSSLSGSVPTSFHITAIADKTPDASGNSVFFNLDGARRLGFVPVWATALLGTQGAQNVNSLSAELRKNGLDVTVATQIPANQTINLFDFMFKGAGILGLVIGGIGVVNTLQVMLARRTLEIAVLKTIGYRERDLLALFGVELLLLGVIGTLLGAGAAVALSAGLVGLLSQTASLLLYWTLDWRLLVGGIVAGLATTLIFGTFAVIQASGVRPALLLREMRRRLTISGLSSAVGLFAVLTIIFIALCSVIMGSLLEGVEIVLAAFAGLIGLGIIFGILLFILIRLPAPRLGVLTLARNNLKRQQLRAIYALIALFAGVFTIGFASMIVSSATARFANHGISLTGNNLAVFGLASEHQQITDQLAKVGLTPVINSYQVPVQVQIGGQSVPVTLDGRDSAPTDLALTGSAWGSAPDGAYVPNGSPISLGSVFTVTAQGGSRTLHVVGNYTANDLSLSDRANSIVVSKAMAIDLGGPSTALLVISAAPVSQLSALTDTLGSSLSTMTVISLADLNDAIQRSFHNLFLLAIAVAGLALVAGAVLIANSVGLAMVERRREMGILKAVGYSSQAVLSTIMLEQGLLGIVGGVIGMAVAALAIALINAAQAKAQIVFDTPQAVVMIGVAVLIALGSAALVAWSPTHQRPLSVLRDE